jgi:hypothetical protein
VFELGSVEGSIGELGVSCKGGALTLGVNKSIAELMHPEACGSISLHTKCRFQVSLFKPSVKALNPLNRLMAVLVQWCIGSTVKSSY